MMDLGDIPWDLINMILLGVTVLLTILFMRAWLEIKLLMRERAEYDEDVAALQKRLDDYNQKLSELLEEASRVRGDIKKKRVTDEMEKIMIKV
jgi:hypothetical protein